MAEQRRRGSDEPDHRVGVGVGQRCQPGRVVGEDLSGDPTEPEHHQRAEQVVVGHADDHLGAVADHWLHQDRVQLVAEALGQLPVGGAHVGLGAQVEFDPACVGLVHETGHVGLEHHRARRGLERADGVPLAVDRNQVGRGYPDAVQQRRGLFGRKPASVTVGSEECPATWPRAWPNSSAGSLNRVAEPVAHRDHALDVPDLVYDIVAHPRWSRASPPASPPRP